MKISIKNLQNIIPINHRQITKILKEVLKSEKINPACEVSLTFVKDKFIKSLNQKYFKKNRPTDVIAFPIDTDKKNKGRMLGEIVISTETVRRNAPVFNNLPKNELNFCVAHGILHLLGYSDRNTYSRSRMLKKQEKILKKLKLFN